MKDPEEILPGTLLAGDKQAISISMPRIHWEGLKWLVDNEEEEGEINKLIFDILNAPSRGDEDDSQIVIWFVEIYMEGIYGEDA